MEEHASFLPGETFAGKYKVESVLGEGGMGVVVAARHLQLDDRVAIKFMRPEVSRNSAGAERFMREARASAKVKSEHIARVFDVGTHDGILYMVMEHLEGQDLASIVCSEGPLPVTTAVEYVLQACEAVAEAHSRGIVHRDLKPENLFLTHRANGSPCLKVLDFGISKIEEPGGGLRMTSTSMLMGSPLYMSPEQLVSPREVDARTDIWSLGVVLYELVSGVQPFVAESLPQLCVKVRETTAPPLRSACPAASAELEAVVARCLEKDPARRFPSIGELAAALAPLVSPGKALSTAGRVVGAGNGRATAAITVERPESAPNETASERRQTELTWHGETSARRSSVPLVAGLALLAVIIGLGAYSLTHRAAPEPTAITPAAATAPEATPLPSPTSSLTSGPTGAGAPAAPEPTVAPEMNTATPTTDAPRLHGLPGLPRRPPAAATSAKGALPLPPDDRK